MLAYIFYGLFILACFILVVAVLLQPGKADAGALFSSSVSSTAFGPRGTQTLLAKLTIGAAAAFMLIGLCLSLPAITGTSSVLESGAPENPAPTATPTPTPIQVTLPAATPALVSTTAPASPAPSKKK